VNSQFCLYCRFRSNEGYCHCPDAKILFPKPTSDTVSFIYSYNEDGCLKVSDYFACIYFITHPRYIDYPQEIGQG